MVSSVLATGLVMSAELSEAQSPQQKKPNIVFILVDNVGWGTFGVYGGSSRDSVQAEAQLGRDLDGERAPQLLGCGRRGSCGRAGL